MRYKINIIKYKTRIKIRETKNVAKINCFYLKLDISNLSYKYIECNSFFIIFFWFLFILIINYSITKKFYLYLIYLADLGFI